MSFSSWYEILLLRFCNVFPYFSRGLVLSIVIYYNFTSDWNLSRKSHYFRVLWRHLHSVIVLLAKRTSVL
jgi:hypothetical protein